MLVKGSPRARIEISDQLFTRRGLQAELVRLICEIIALSPNLISQEAPNLRNGVARNALESWREPTTDTR